jgi:hypothetical protein
MKTPEKKAREPTERSAADVVFFALECSQRIGQWITLLAIVHNLGTSIAVVIFPYAKEALLDVLETCQSLYRISISAYFGKAAVENALKIWTTSKEIETSTTAKATTTGNG